MRRRHITVNTTWTETLTVLIIQGLIVFLLLIPK
jgi:hypothetical protein